MAADPILKKSIEDCLKRERKKGVLKPRVQSGVDSKGLEECLDELGFPYREISNPNIIGKEFEVDLSDPQVEFE